MCSVTLPVSNEKSSTVVLISSTSSPLSHDAWYRFCTYERALSCCITARWCCAADDHCSWWFFIVGVPCNKTLLFTLLPTSDCNTSLNTHRFNTTLTDHRETPHTSSVSAFLSLLPPQNFLFHAYAVRSRQDFDSGASISKFPSHLNLYISNTACLSFLDWFILKIWTAHCNVRSLIHIINSNDHHFGDDSCCASSRLSRP